MEIKRSGSQPSAKGPAEWFTGTVRIDPLFDAPVPARAAGASVTFEPGARTAWHTHPLGQTLIVTSGVGRAQRWGGPIEEIRPGDVVWFSPGEKHWHGAAPTTAMTHIAIQEKLDGKPVDWLEHVTPEQYRRTVRRKLACDRSMARIFITGSTDGLGRAAAQALIQESHQVVLHARSPERAAALDDLATRSAGVVIGDLSSATDTRNVANQVNALGRMDAVIHNAGAYSTKGRSPTPEGHPTIIAVNALAPYVLTALMERPRRLVYLSSGMHRDGSGSLRDIDWSERRWNSSQAYSDSKLYLTALAFAVARRWPDVLSNAVDPGWVATKMGGAGAPDDFEEGYLTQTWLAVSEDRAATVSGRYWHHRRPLPPAKEVEDPVFQDQLSARLADMTGVSLF